MTEPRNEPTLPHAQAASGGVSHRYFWLGAAIFVAVALAHPFYSYQVHARLAARDVAAEIPMEPAPLNPSPVAMSAAEERQAAIAASAAAATSAVALPSGATVVGTTLAGTQRTVIVDLAGQNLDEAVPSLCRQASAQFRQSLAGERVLVKRYRENEAPEDLGAMVCD